MDEEEKNECLPDDRFLSGMELVNLRKPPELPHARHVGQKGYFADGKEETIKSLLEEQRALLSLNRAARVNDMMKGQWDMEKRKTVVEVLKGKFTSHIGRPFEKKHLLCPEETIFFVENGTLELSYGGRPLSTEEAYAIVLTEEMAIEKYRVYAHLSRQGFIVVAHQGKINKKRYGNLMKAQFKRHHKGLKRKMQSLKGGCKRKKRRNNAGSNIKSEEVASSPVGLLHEENVSDANSKLQEEIESTESSDSDSEDWPLHEVTQLKTEPIKEAEICKENIDEEVGERNKEDAAIAVSSSQIDSLSIETAEVSETMVENVTDNNVAEGGCDEVMDVEDAASVEVEKEVGGDEGKINERNEIVTSSVADSANDSVQKQIAGVDDQSTGQVLDGSIEVETPHSIVEKVGESSGGTFRECESLHTSVIADGGNSHSSMEPTISLDTDDSLIGADENSVTLVKDDEDVAFVGVVQKKKVLSVIDLLSDDEDSDIQVVTKSRPINRQSAEDEDEVQIIGEVSPTPAKTPKSKKNFKYDLLYNQPSYPRSESDASFNSRVKWAFPNLLRKSIVCLPRPAPHLLPLAVRFSKEAYTLSLNMVTASSYNPQAPRVWKSYRDLQERRRNDSQSTSSRNFSFTGSPFQPTNSSTNPVAFGYNQPPPFNPPRQDSMRSPSHPSFHPPIDVRHYLEHAQKTAMHVAQTVLQQMTMNLGLPHNFHSPRFPGADSSHSEMFNMFGTTQPWNSPFNFHQPMRGDLSLQSGSPSPTLSANRVPPIEQQGMSRNSPQTDGPHGNGNNSNYHISEYPYPSSIPKLGTRAHTWEEFKTVIGETPEEEDCNDEIDAMDQQSDMGNILWSTPFKPLVKPGMQSYEDVMAALRITKSFSCFNLPTTSDSETTCSLSVSFDVYLPGAYYKKTIPGIPHRRIVVLRDSDPIPEMSDVVSLEKRFDDSAVLQFAVVTHSDISYCCFSHVNVPNQTPKPLKQAAISGATF